MKKVVSILALTLLIATAIVLAVSAENTNTVVQEENLVFTREKLNEIISGFDMKLSSSKNKEKDIKSNGYAYNSVVYTDCINYKVEPVLHDLLTLEEVKALLGEPDYEKDNVLIYKNIFWLFAFKDDKLEKLALMSRNGDVFFVKEIFDALNLQEVRTGIEEKIQEEKSFKEKRDAILNSDEELYKLIGMSGIDIYKLLGAPDETGGSNLFQLLLI